MSAAPGSTVLDLTGTSSQESTMFHYAITEQFVKERQREAYSEARRARVRRAARTQRQARRAAQRAHRAVERLEPIWQA